MAAYLAFDLGAESGRAFLGELKAGQIAIREVHRFANEPVEYGGAKHWDAPRMWLEMQRAMGMLGEAKLAGIGVDAWGVDYALLGERGELLQNPYHYRDPRSLSAFEEAMAIVPREQIYAATGIQLMAINTLYQLFAARRDTPSILAAAQKLIMMPDLFHYWMTGNAVCEYTDASTTQFMNPATRGWSTELLERLGLPVRLLTEIVEPGTVVGAYRGTPVIAPGSHDTASAVAAIDARKHTAFISSGTWSLIGTELDAPIVSEEARRHNFTNEGGVCGTTRFLKNVMGLWMLQGCRRSWSAAGREYSYSEINEAAEDAAPLQAFVDPDDSVFLSPVDMPAAIADYCRRTGQPVPESEGGYARTILQSLALKYRIVIEGMERVTGNRIDTIRVIGGGSKSGLLNQLTADATGRRVIAGPTEAAVLGNIGVQMMATGEASSLQEIRAVIERSFPHDCFEPRETAKWDRAQFPV